MAPLEPVIKGKRLLLVPAGALTSLPFQVLITTPPAKATPPPEDYGKADWLIRRHALSILPSVASLRAVRLASNAPSASKPLIGYGAPLFSSQPPILPPGSPAHARSAGTSKASPGRTPRGSVAEVSKGLQPLPETAAELQQVARLVGATEKDLALGVAASETNVKRTNLQDFRVVYFATHGLVADEIADLGEPALALTPPAKPSESDDGMLTASEIAQLKLNADWVVLSACNTAAGNKPGAEALSGLARAFFHAGARALLVSHWRVYSEAASHITTGIFRELATDARIGRDEASRCSMLQLIGHGSTEYVQPAYWAPFVVVGDGAGR